MICCCLEPSDPQSETNGTNSSTWLTLRRLCATVRAALWPVRASGGPKKIVRKYKHFDEADPLRALFSGEFSAVSFGDEECLLAFLAADLATTANFACISMLAWIIFFETGDSLFNYSKDRLTGGRMRAEIGSDGT